MLQGGQLLFNTLLQNELMEWCDRRWKRTGQNDADGPGQQEGYEEADVKSRQRYGCLVQATAVGAVCAVDQVRARDFVQICESTRKPEHWMCGSQRFCASQARSHLVC